MSKEAMEQVVLKASSDARFRTQLSDNFEAAIKPYDLTQDEKDELRKSDVATASELPESKAATEASLQATTAATTHTLTNME